MTRFATSRRALALAAVFAFTALPAWALKPFSATYQATVKGIQADAQMTLAAAGGDRWTYDLNVKSPVASIRQSTTFSANGDVWRPLSGTDTTQVLIKKSQKNAIYDWDARQARWSGDINADRAGPIALKDGDVDAMLINLAIIRDAAAGKPLNYRLVDNGVVRQHNYQPMGKESITIDGQSRSASKFSRSSDDKQVIVWVVDGLPVPARILQREGGKDALDLVLKSVR